MSETAVCLTLALAPVELLFPCRPDETVDFYLPRKTPKIQTDAHEADPETDFTVETCAPSQQLCQMLASSAA